MDKIELENRQKKLLDELGVELEKLNKKLLRKLEERKMDREIKIVNRGKVAYLYTNGIFEDRIEKIERNGQEMYAFVFKNDEELQELLNEFDKDIELKKYNASFKHVALAIKKCKMRD